MSKDNLQQVMPVLFKDLADYGFTANIMEMVIQSVYNHELQRNKGDNSLTKAAFVQASIMKANPTFNQEELNAAFKKYVENNKSKDELDKTVHNYIAETHNSIRATSYLNNETKKLQFYAELYWDKDVESDPVMNLTNLAKANINKTMKNPDNGETLVIGNFPVDINTYTDDGKGHYPETLSLDVTDLVKKQIK